MVDMPEAGKPVPPGTEVILSGLPMMAATGGQIAEVEDDYILSFTRPITGHVVDGGQTHTVAQIRPIAEILISRGNLEKIGKMIQEVLAKTAPVVASRDS